MPGAAPEVEHLRAAVVLDQRRQGLEIGALGVDRTSEVRVSARAELPANQSLVGFCRGHRIINSNNSRIPEAPRLARSYQTMGVPLLYGAGPGCPGPIAVARLTTR